MSGTGNSAAAYGDSFALADGAGLLLAGTDDAVTASSGGSLVATGGGDSLHVKGASDTATISGGTVNLADGASATLTGSSDSVTAGNAGTVGVSGTANTVTVSGVGTTVDAAGQGNAVSISSGAVNLAAGGSASVSGVVGIFPNEASITRLVGAILLEQNDAWPLQHRYMTLETMAGRTDEPTALTHIAA